MRRTYMIKANALAGSAAWEYFLFNNIMIPNCAAHDNDESLRVLLPFFMLHSIVSGLCILLSLSIFLRFSFSNIFGECVFWLLSKVHCYARPKPSRCNFHAIQIEKGEREKDRKKDLNRKLRNVVATSFFSYSFLNRAFQCTSSSSSSPFPKIYFSSSERSLNLTFRRRF